MGHLRITIGELVKYKQPKKQPSALPGDKLMNDILSAERRGARDEVSAAFVAARNMGLVAVQRAATDALGRMVRGEPSPLLTTKNDSPGKKRDREEAKARRLNAARASLISEYCAVTKSNPGGALDSLELADLRARIRDARRSMAIRAPEKKTASNKKKK